MTSTRPITDSGRTAKGNARRSEILHAAVDVFTERGYEGASLREIAARAGISKGNLTYYFAVKDDLLYEVVGDLHDGFLDLTDGWCTAACPRRAFRAAAREHVLLVCHRLSATRVSYENFRYLSDERRAKIVEKRNRYELAVAALVESCKPRLAEVASTALLTRSVIAMLNWPYQWYSPTGDLGPDDLAAGVAELAVRLLGPTPNDEDL